MLVANSSGQRQRILPIVSLSNPNFSKSETTCTKETPWIENTPKRGQKIKNQYGSQHVVKTKLIKPSGGKTKCLNNDNLKNEGGSLDIQTHTHTHLAHPIFR